METPTIPIRKVHHGHNVKRLREMLGVKQETLAEELNLSQQSMSRIEAKEEIEDEVLEKVAKVLKVPVDAIKNFSDEATISFISNTFNSTHGFISSAYSNCNFNPIEKIVELYERMLNLEREKVVLLEKLLQEKK